MYIPSTHVMKNTYLVAFNAASCAGWVLVLVRAVSRLAGGARLGGGGVVEEWVQSLAVLDVVHAAMGLVRSPLLTAAVQVTSRLLVLLLLPRISPGLRRSRVLDLVLLAWSVADATRYLFYTLQLLRLRRNVGFVTWLRYNGFLLLYPAGVAGEMALVTMTVPDARRVHPLAPVALYALLAIYPPGLYMLYTHLLRQRRRMQRGKRREL